MLIRNRDARTRTQKKTEGANTNTTHLAQSGQTLKGHGTKKNEGRQTRNKTRGGGAEAPEPTYRSEIHADLSTHRAYPTQRKHERTREGPVDQ